MNTACGSRPHRFILMCGNDELGVVEFDSAENWHCYGTLTPGIAFSKYQASLENLADALGREDERIDDASDFEADILATAVSEAQLIIDGLGLYLQEQSSGSAHRIHDFKVLNRSGRVYWRFDS